jgi:hypothetical protein
VHYPVPDCSPGLPGDPQDHERDSKSDQGVSDIQAERYDDGARHDGETDERVGAGVVAVGYQCRAVQSLPRA